MANVFNPILTLARTRTRTLSLRDFIREHWALAHGRYGTGGSKMLNRFVSACGNGFNTPAQLDEFIAFFYEEQGQGHGQGHGGGEGVTLTLKPTAKAAANAVAQVQVQVQAAGTLLDTASYRISIQSSSPLVLA